MKKLKLGLAFAAILFGSATAIAGSFTNTTVTVFTAGGSESIAYSDFEASACPTSSPTITCAIVYDQNHRPVLTYKGGLYQP